MFGKFKDMLNNISNSRNTDYVVDIKTFEEFLKNELNLSIQNNTEFCVNMYIYYREEKHSISVWNLLSSSLKSERQQGLSVTFDKIEYNSIDNLLNSASIRGEILSNIKDYFVIELIDTDNEFLNNFKRNNPQLLVEDYKGF